MNIQQTRIGSKNRSATTGKYHLLFTVVCGLLFLLVSNIGFINEAHAASCGALNQSACKITFKRLKACNKGLHKNWKTKKCVSNKNLVPKPIRNIIPPKQKNCGKLGQRACKIIPPRLKACDLHLVKDKSTGKCRKIKPIIKPKPKNCGKLGQRACSRPHLACKIPLVKDKNTGKCRKIKPIIKPRPKNCGKLGQRACSSPHLACKIPLVKDKSTGKCRKIKPIIKPRPKNCGKLDQRACSSPHLACKIPLVKDKSTGKCRKIKPIIPPKQKNCGKLGQYACKIQGLRVKACDLHLVKDKQTGKCRKFRIPKQKNCGKLGQNACKIQGLRVKACDFHLVKDKQTGKCRKLRIKANPLTIINTAKKIANESVSLIKIMGTGYSCFVLNPPLASAAINALQGKKREQNFIKELKHVINKKDVNAAIRLASSKCMKKTVATAAREGYNTITIGVSSGGSAGLGSFLDTGFAFDIKALNRLYKKQTNTIPMPTLYQTKGGSIGLQAGVGNSFSMGLSKSINKANPRSRTHGATLALAAVAGVGTGVWFDYDGQLDGISAAITGGAEFEAAYNKLVTSTYNLPKPKSAPIRHCGGRYKPACKKSERDKACNNGLKHNLRTGQCEPRKSTVRIKPYPGMKLPKCGDNGQRVCTVQEQIPGCNSGLKIDFNIKRCVYK